MRLAFTATFEMDVSSPFIAEEQHAHLLQQGAAEIIQQFLKVENLQVQYRRLSDVDSNS